MKRLRSTYRNLVIAGLALVTVPAALASGPGLASTSWPMYGADPRHTGRSPFTGITGSPAVVWKQPRTTIGWGATGYGMSQGTDGSILLTSDASLVALDPDDGSQRWSSRRALNGYGVYGNSTPAVAADGSMYWGFTNSMIRLSSTGDVVSTYYNLDTNIQFGGSPTIAADGTVYAVHDALWSFDASGGLNWFFPFGDYAHGSPAIGADGTIYVGGDSQLWAFTPDGDVKWSRNLGVDAYGSASIGDDGTIYIGVGKGTLVALDPNGTTKWTFDSLEAADDNGLPGFSLAIAPDGTIYMGTYVSGLMTQNAHIYAVRPDGTLKWSYPIPRMADDEIGNPGAIAGWVTDRDSNVYGCATRATCYGFTTDGELLWTYETVDIKTLPSTGGDIRTTPLISHDGVMYIVDGTGWVQLLADSALNIQRAEPSGLRVRVVPAATGIVRRELVIGASHGPVAWTLGLDPGAAWLTASLRPGGSTLEVAIDPAGLRPGTYTGKLRVQTGAEGVANPTLLVPVTLVIDGRTLLPAIMQR